MVWNKKHWKYTERLKKGRYKNFQKRRKEIRTKSEGKNRKEERG